MLLRKICLLAVVGLFFSCFAPLASAETNEWMLIHGSVLQVFPEVNRIMLQSDGNTFIFGLEAGCEILRYGCPTALESLRPITSTDFQDALCWINPRGLISCILVNYSVCEEGGSLVNRDIFGNVK